MKPYIRNLALFQFNVMRMDIHKLRWNSMFHQEAVALVKASPKVNLKVINKIEIIELWQNIITQA